MKKDDSIKNRPLRFILATVKLAIIIYLEYMVFTVKFASWEYLIIAGAMVYLTFDVFILYFQSFGYNLFNHITNTTPLQKPQPIAYIYENGGKVATKEDLIYVPNTDPPIGLWGNEYYIDDKGRVIISERTYDRYYIYFYGKVKILWSKS